MRPRLSGQGKVKWETAPTSLICGRASMRPRLSGQGKFGADRGPAPGAEASMRPRLSGQGKMQGLTVATVQRLGASMRPRLSGQGKPLGHDEVDCVQLFLLQ